MNLSPAFVQIIVGIIISQALNGVWAIYFLRFKKREEMPEHLGKEIAEVRREMVSLRVDVARIKGRINGHGWKQEA